MDERQRILVNLKHAAEEARVANPSGHDAYAASASVLLSLARIGRAST